MYDIENYYNAETIKEAVLLLKEPSMQESFPAEVMF